MLLAAALEKATAGERILLCGYGQETRMLSSSSHPGDRTIERQTGSLSLPGLQETFDQLREISQVPKYLA